MLDIVSRHRHEVIDEFENIVGQSKGEDIERYYRCLFACLSVPRSACLPACLSACLPAFIPARLPRHLPHILQIYDDNRYITSRGRHVVAYKKGFEPIEVTEEEAAAATEAQVAASKERTAAAKRRAAQEKKSQVNGSMPPANFVKVSTVKRDRRTIEDYQNVSKSYHCLLRTAGLYHALSQRL